MLEFFTTPSKSSLIVLVSIIVLLSLYFLVMTYFRRISKRKNNHLDNLPKRFKIPLILLLLVAVLQIINSFVVTTPFIYEVLTHINQLVLILSIAWGIISSIHLLDDMIMVKYDMHKQDNLKARKVYTQFRVLENIVIFIIILVALGIALMTFSEIKKIGISLFASAGVAGIIIGFAAQKVIGSVLAGIQIAITQPIRIDDAVIVENEWGWIEEITLTYVVVKLWDKRRLVLPSTYFIETPFQNWTRNSADILGTVFLYTDYAVPFDKVREEVTRLLQITPLWDGEVNIVQVTDCKDTTVEIRILVSAKDSPTAFDLRVFIREGLITFLQQHYPESLPKTRVKMV